MEEDALKININLDIFTILATTRLSISPDFSSNNASERGHITSAHCRHLCWEGDDARRSRARLTAGKDASQSIRLLRNLVLWGIVVCIHWQRLRK